ncbi:MAG: serine/threonine protein kinase [Flavobacteriaceae bacterium]|nr:serine/threonine protein kinase [Flavobacteriaceae bacterium]|tara:strand:+ start:72343 stop:72900 length:558 start_codon:yes stop_codon:yes gene_type:complete
MNFLRFLISKVFFKQLAIAVIGFFVLVFGLKFWLGFTTNHNQKIEVPDLHKLPIDKAAEKLKESDLDFIVIDSANYNPTYPKKSVIEQSPEAGDFVKEKRKIYLTLNPSKYRDVTLPKLNGKTKRQAISNLRSIGINVGTNFTYVTDIGKDVVRGIKFNGKTLNPGDKIPLNSIVELILGDGKGR